MIETTITKIQYDADGVQRRWSIPFQYADAKHISIYTKVGEEPTVKVIDNYDIDEDDSVVIYPTVESGQEPLTAGVKITIARETPETQLEDASQVHFTSKDVERGLDKLTMITQELSTTASETMEVSSAAFESAEEAVSTANEANATAAEAKTLAGQAVSVANDANATATAANTKSDTAIKIANDANEKSTAAVYTANTAKTVADEANSTANNANATATKAKEIATAANTTANNADKTANEADKTADNAFIIANNAKSIAEGIDAKATQALDNSNTAINTANSAKQTAEGIDAKATQALTNSTDAKNIADSYQGQITTLRNDVDDLGYQVSQIEAKIPGTATENNQLADKAFVTEKTDKLAADITALGADIQKINLIKWVQALPATGESKYLYAVPQEQKTLDGENIVLLFVWNDTDGWATVGVQTTAVDLSEYAKQLDLAAETSARQEADQALDTAVSSKYGPDNLTAGSGVEIKEYTAPTLIDAHTLAVFKFEDTAVPAENSVAEGAVFVNRGGAAGAATTAYGAKFGAGAYRCASSSTSGWLQNSDGIANADFTVDFWVKWGNSGRAGVCTGVSSDAPTGRGAVFYKNKISLPQAVGTGYINNDAAFDTAYDGETWHHCAYVQDGSAYRAYIDGVQVASGAYSSLPTYSDLYVWGWGGVLIDEVRVSDIARYDGNFTPNTQPYAYAEHKQYEITATANGAGLPLLSVHWSDHLLNRMDMLRADTFSWQDGTVYTAAYQELLGEYNLVDKFYPFSYTGASTGPIQYFCKDLIPAVGDAVYELGNDGVYIPATANDVALLVTSVKMDTNYFGHETALIGITGYGKFIQGDYGSTGKIEDTAPRFSAGILETENGVSFVRTPKGYKICTADQHDNVSALYDSTGAAWYYILDVPNQRFKLPRTKFGFTGLRTGAGNYVAPGLPDHTHKTPYGKNDNGNYHAQGGARPHISTDEWFTTIKGYGKDSTPASASNDIYGSSQTVQPPATEMYLYFFVGNFTQSAVEQTAGISAETLNNKADLDGMNAPALMKVPQFWQGADFAKMRAAIMDLDWANAIRTWSSTADNYRTEVMPADGLLAGVLSYDGQIEINGNRYSTHTKDANWGAGYVPFFVKKGDVVKARFNSSYSVLVPFKNQGSADYNPLGFFQYQGQFADSASLPTPKINGWALVGNNQLYYVGTDDTGAPVWLAGNTITDLGVTGADYVVDSYDDGAGNGWYEYKSGRLVQYGFTTHSSGTSAGAYITFYRPMANTSYNYCVMPRGFSGGNAFSFGAGEFSVSGFRFSWDGGNVDPEMVCWRVEGLKGA